MSAITDRLDAELATMVSRIPEGIDPASGLEDPATVALLRDTAALNASLGQSLPDHPAVSVTNRIILGADDQDLRIRIYEPDTAPRPAPALLFLHGGAFVIGDPEAEEHRCLRLAAEASCLVVSVDYRLAPEHRFPAGVEDAYAALTWTAETAPSLGVDAGRLAVGGNSAGGALAAALALMSRDRSGPALVAQLLVYPVIDDRLVTASVRGFSAAPLWTSEGCEVMWRLYLGEEPRGDDVSPYAAPVRAGDLSGLPPAYVLTCQYDPLRDEGIAYAQALMHAGVDTELHNMAGTFHGFDSVAPDSVLGRRAVGEQVAALRRAFA